MAWPSTEFLGLSCQDQQAFWAKAGDLCEEESGLKYGKLRALLKKTLVREREVSYQTKYGGSFQPLTYYAGQGYDTAKIAKNSLPTNIRWHDVLECDVYRLEIASSEKSIIDREVDSHIQELERKVKEGLLKRKSKDKGDKGEGAEERAETEKGEKTEVISSSSTSSSSDKKKKKDQKRKIEKQDAALPNKTTKQIEAESKAAQKQRYKEAQDKDKEEKKARDKAEKAIRTHNAAQASLATKAAPVPLGRFYIFCI